MKLNNNHYLFIDEYMINGNNATQAYKKVYPKASPETASVNSTKLMADPGIQEILKKKNNEMAERNNIKKDDILATVLSIMTDDELRPSDRLKASEILLKALGYNEPEKTEISGGLENKVIKIKYKKNEDEE